MQDNIYTKIKTLLSSYVDVPEQQLQMSADLFVEYGMDSTEMTALTKELEERFQLAIDQSDSSSIWVTGNEIVDFVQKQTTRAVMSSNEA